MPDKQKLLNHFQEVGDEVCVLYLEGRYKENKERYTTYDWLNAMGRIQKYNEHHGN